MAIYKFCARCNTKIPHTERYCTKCKEEVEKNNRKRYKRYNMERYSNKEERKYINFYSSNEWINERDFIKIRDCGLCIPCFYSLYNGEEVVYKEEDTCSSDYVHHIIELKEDWDKRIDDMNLISVCSCHHDRIHREYEKGIKEKAKMQKALIKILKWYLDNFKF